MLLEWVSSKPIILILGLLFPVILVTEKRIRSRSSSSRPPYPPGPVSPRMPTRDAYVKYKEWGQEYGDLVYIQEENVLILNSLRSAIDLLEKRARIYSDREFTRMMEMYDYFQFITVFAEQSASSGASFNFGMIPYSDDWRRKRRHFGQNFRAAAIKQFYPAQLVEIHKFLNNLITTPKDFLQHTMSVSQGIIFSAVYGLSVLPSDRLAHIAVEVVNAMGATLIPGEFRLIEVLPWLRFLPSWLPGWRFQRIAKNCRMKATEMHNVPFDIAVANMKSGLRSSLVAELAAKNEGNPAEIERIKAMATVCYIDIQAGGDTTMGAISSFILAMTLHQDVQIRAQEEIDRVVGRNRLPTFDDRKSLPYVEAIYREVMRFYPVLPIGVPHKSTEDDWYRGYYIPKGCNVIANIGINRDAKIHHNPDEFDPERFLKSPGGPFSSINDIIAYGFGRRVCAGRYMADATVWLAIASVLATLRLAKAKDADGNEIDFIEEHTDEFFRHPKPFPCSITPRYELAEMLIRDSVD